MIIMASIETVKKYNPNHLSDLAECASPDSWDSAGAVLLDGVRDAVVEAWIEGRVDSGDDGDLAHEIADNAPSVYTHTLWQEFLDLCAYQEEPESGVWPDDLGKAAAIALYQIAERLVYALLEVIREGDDEEEEPLPTSIRLSLVRRD